ncbi:oxidoreductase [Tateyamaria omphalii]|uniref:alpha/beta fold hydrolase n=1 Tax=Tateyamaria omphalii TaxID=299262 RepID=UPI0016784FA3|nr:alpha/beta hydrolase [Tateyamaria omphalii]GGX71172.1 oxidoreductase [Tateyamaria omphalii]
MKHEDFVARQKHITLDAVAHIPIDIAYSDLGEGPLLIVMHGIPTWSFLYHEVLDRLAKTNRVIAPDFIGHGMSDQRDLFDRSLRAQRDMIVSLMNALDISNAALVGHDTGGGVALIMAIENAERVDKLVLSNTVAYDSWPIDDMISVGHPDWARRPNAEIREFLVGGFDDGLSRKERLTKEFVEGIVAPYITDAGKVSLARNASGLNTSHTTMLVGRHHKISAKTLLVWGEDDPWQPISDGERLANDIPEARLVRVRNASHWIPQDAPDEWLSAVQPFVSAPA